VKPERPSGPNMEANRFVYSKCLPELSNVGVAASCPTAALLHNIHRAFHPGLPCGNQVPLGGPVLDSSVHERPGGKESVLSAKGPLPMLNRRATLLTLSPIFANIVGSLKPVPAGPMQAARQFWSLAFL